MLFSYKNILFDKLKLILDKESSNVKNNDFENPMNNK